MPADPPLWPAMLILLLILSFYALCTACETALASISEAARSRLADRTDPHARLLTRIISDPEHFQSAVHLAALAAETVWFIYGLSVLFPLFPLDSGFAAALSGLILACLLWLFGRMLPRRATLSDPASVGLALCPLFQPMVTLLTPLTLLFLLLAKGILLVFQITPTNTTDEFSVEEIRAMVDIGSESGTIESNEKEMIENIFDFTSITAEEIMVHRTDMTLVSLDSTREEVLALIEQSGLSRFPAYDEDADDIKGILYTRDYLLELQRSNPRPLSQLLRPAYFVPESVSADTLFHDMQSRAVQMALVVDEYGGTSGLITLEDLLEELVGNIYDEFDRKAEQEITPLGENLWRITGSAPLESVSEALGITFPEDTEAETLGGLVFSCLSVIPEDGAAPEVDVCDLHICVERISERRVETALVSLNPPEAHSDND